MAYGLDIVDLIYTDSELVDQGTLNDYIIDLDIAKDKNFELRSDKHIMTNGSLWYVDGTEFGGIVGSFESNSDDDNVIYKGRSFRGMIDSKIIEVPEGLNVASYSGAISAVTNQILEEYDLDSFFICETPILDEDLDVAPIVGQVDILSGTTVYDALTKIADSINYTYLYEYVAKEHKVHMTPVLTQNWIDLLAYNRDNAEKFKSSLSDDFINHLICSGIDEDGFRRTIHLFLDANGELQPYATKDTPLKDEDYILDKSSKVLTGIREIASYYETQISVETNYELLEEQPSDWTDNYESYFEKKSKDSLGTYETKKIGESRHITFDEYQTLDSLSITQGEGELVITLTAGEDWYLYQPETVTIFSFVNDYRNWPVTIGETEYTISSKAIVEIPTADLPEEYTVTSRARQDLYGYSSDELDLNIDYWIADPITRSKTIEFISDYGVNENVSVAEKKEEEASYEAVQPVDDTTYTLVSSQPTDWTNNYSYYFKRSWSSDNQEFTYSAYGSTTQINMNNLIRITSKPSDWNYNFGEYYYKFFNGISYEPKAYQGTSRDVYTLLTGQPDDWTTNFGSYYQIAYEVTYKKNKKTQTTIKYSVSAAKKVSGFKSYKQIYTSVPERKKKKGQKNYHKWPDWVRNKYYSKSTVTDPPGFNGSNCYLPTMERVRPSYEAGNCFERTESKKAPDFAAPDENGNGIYYREVKDHYYGLVRNGVDTLLNQDVGDSYDVTVDDYEFNIGDIVGGEDEITGLNMPQKITNKIFKIDSGVVYIDYEIGG